MLHQRPSQTLLPTQSTSPQPMQSNPSMVDRELTKSVMIPSQPKTNYISNEPENQIRCLKTSDIPGAQTRRFRIRKDRRYNQLDYRDVTKPKRFGAQSQMNQSYDVDQGFFYDQTINQVVPPNGSMSPEKRENYMKVAQGVNQAALLNPFAWKQFVDQQDPHLAPQLQNQSIIQQVNKSYMGQYQHEAPEAESREARLSRRAVKQLPYLNSYENGLKQLGERKSNQDETGSNIADFGQNDYSTPQKQLPQAIPNQISSVKRSRGSKRVRYAEDLNKSLDIQSRAIKKDLYLNKSQDQESLFVDQLRTSVQAAKNWGIDDKTISQSTNIDNMQSYLRSPVEPSLTTLPVGERRQILKNIYETNKQEQDRNLLTMDIKGASPMVKRLSTQRKVNPANPDYLLPGTGPTNTQNQYQTIDVAQQVQLPNLKVGDDCFDRYTNKLRSRKKKFPEIQSHAVTSLSMGNSSRPREQKHYEIKSQIQSYKRSPDISFLPQKKHIDMNPSLTSDLGRSTVEGLQSVNGTNMVRMRSRKHYKDLDTFPPTAPRIIQQQSQTPSNFK